MKKYTNDELLRMDAVEVYKLRLDRKIHRFPSGFWQLSEGKENAKKCVIYLLEEVLGYKSDESIKKNFGSNTLEKNCLGGMLSSELFNFSPFEVLDNAYKGRFKPWQLSQCPIYYWKEKENRDYALKYLFEEVINIEDDDFVERYDANLFIENDLFGLLKNYFDGSPYKVLDYYFEGKIKPWHLKQGPKNYFKSKENRINAVKWLIEEELKWSEEDVIKGWCNELLHKHGIDWALKYIDGNSHYYLLDEAYPGIYKPWLVCSGVDGFWEEKENRVWAVKWLVEDVLGFTKEECFYKLKAKHFIANKLSGLYRYWYKCNINEIISDVYPDMMSFKF